MVSKLVQSRLPCPSCPSSDAYHLYDDGHGYCFSCSYFKPAEGAALSSEEFSYEYLPWRGITKETMAFYDVKTKIDKDGKPISLGFPYGADAYQVRLLDTKDFYWHNPSNIKVGLFGKEKFNAGQHRYVTITEGATDALSYHQVLRSPVVSVQSASSAARDCTIDRAWLNSFERIYLAFDNDAPGREAASDVARLFDYNKIYVVKFTNRKDANEYLKAGEEEVLRNVWWNAKRYCPEIIRSTFAEFKEILEKPLKKGVPYPFKQLTEMTYGIRKGETVLITAQEKVGKTEIMHFIEHKLLKETEDNVGAIFLEEDKQRHLLALAGIERQAPIHLPDHSIPSADVLDTLQNLVRLDERLHLYSHFGSADPDVILDHIRFLVSARSCAYILLDHLSMVCSGLGGEDIRKAIDYIVTRLEMMVKELEFALIMVCHVNDNGQTRDSRYPTKVADITINLTRNLMSLDNIERNTWNFTVPYNRYCGNTGPAGSVVFNPMKYSFKEAANDNIKDMSHGLQAA